MIVTIVDRPKREKFVANILSIEEFNTILDSLNTSNYYDYLFDLALKIVIELGVRRGELGGLEWENVDFKNHCINIKNNLIYSNGKVYVGTTKTDESERTIYISDDLRHTNASLLLEQGVDFKVIQTRLGHSNINTTLNIYSHINLKMQQSATEKLSAILSGGKMVEK